MAVVTDGTFGIRLQLADGGVLSVADVDTNEQTVRRFLARLMGEEIDSDQLHYLIQDLLQEIYDGTTP